MHFILWILKVWKQWLTSLGFFLLLKEERKEHGHLIHYGFCQVHQQSNCISSYLPCNQPGRQGMLCMPANAQVVSHNHHQGNWPFSHWVSSRHCLPNGTCGWKIQSPHFWHHNNSIFCDRRGWTSSCIDFTPFKGQVGGRCSRFRCMMLLLETSCEERSFYDNTTMMSKFWCAWSKIQKWICTE